MRTFTSFKEFHKALTEDTVDLNKINIAKQSLIISDMGSRVAGCMPKSEAVKVLKSAGMANEDIKRLLITGGALPSEITELLK